MKKFSKILSVALLVALVLSLGVANAFAQTIGNVADDTATITINNAAKGETYTIYKLFDATVTGTESGSIAYTGEIPGSLSDYFTKDSAGNISATAAAGTGDAMSDGLKTALKNWTTSATPVAYADSDGSVLKFVGLDYGYYIVTTSQGDQAITVNSTNPNASIYDKNSSTPKNLSKTVDDDDVFIGQTVTYTVKFQTSNYDGGDSSAKQIVSYTVTDTLPEFLTDVVVNSVVVDNDADETTTADQESLTGLSFGTDKSFTIVWATEDVGSDPATYTSKYENGALVIVTYTAKVTEKAAIAGEGNKNTVTLSWTHVDNTPGPDELHAEEVIYTFAFGLKKVNQTGVALGGATFQLPFYVKSEPDTDGAYFYAGTTAGDGLTNTLTTDAAKDGVIIIKGIQSTDPDYIENSKDAYNVTETVAPDGYNKLTAAVPVTVTKTSETTTTITKYMDENGNIVEEDKKVYTVNYTNELIAASGFEVVVNKTGTQLPSTGGIGTTIFYVVGGVLVLAAIILLVTKKRMSE